MLLPYSRDFDGSNGQFPYADTAVCFRETIFAIVPNVCLFLLLLLFYCFCVVKSGGGLEDHIQGVLIGGRSPRRVRTLFHCGHAY